MSDLMQAVVGVCGAGAMGVGIAQVALQAGHAVVVLDTNEAALGAGEAALARSLAGLVKRGRLEETQVAAMMARVSWSTAVEALAGAGLVIEAIVENEAIKADLFARIEAVTDPQTVLATNTSSLSVTRLGAGLLRPSRFLGLHFFNPAAVMKLVEVVPGPETEAALGEQAQALMIAWGKTPVRVCDVPGFIVNRVARPYYAEGFRAWAEQVAAPEVIDALLKAAAGFRMGPLELADMIGHDVNYAVARSIHDAYFGQTRFTPQLAQGQLVDAGRLGRKSGRGVFDYAAAVPSAGPAPSRKIPRRIAIGPGVELALADRLATAGAVFSDAPAGCIDVDGVLVARSDGRMAASRSAEYGKPFVVLDWMEPGTETVGFSVCGDRARSAAQALVSAAGWTGYELADRPGLLVLRVLAQLANAAADAVRDRVAEASGIDRAMKAGANYPFGPLAWADRYGRAALIRTLDNIATETGEALYRPSEYFRRAG